jgi:hypothetical protein
MGRGEGDHSFEEIDDRGEKNRHTGKADIVQQNKTIDQRIEQRHMAIGLSPYTEVE